MNICTAEDKLLPKSARPVRNHHRNYVITQFTLMEKRTLKLIWACPTCIEYIFNLSWQSSLTITYTLCYYYIQINNITFLMRKWFASEKLLTSNETIWKANLMQILSDQRGSPNLHCAVSSWEFGYYAQKYVFWPGWRKTKK